MMMMMMKRRDEDDDGFLREAVFLEVPLRKDNSNHGSNSHNDGNDYDDNA